MWRSPRTSTIDATSKLEEYRSHPDIRLILSIEPDIVSAKLYRRDESGGWTIEQYDDLGQVVSMPEIGSELALADVYDTLNPVVRPRLRLVEES